MLFTATAALSLLALTSAFSDKAVHEQSRSRARQLHARKPSPDAELEKRGDTYSGRATFYDVGLGACGWYNSRNDYIVAQNSAQYGGGYPGPNCGKSISISYGGKTLTATIADECPTCPYGGLDMSRGLFDAFASEDLGQFQMTWWYNDGSSSNDQATTTSTTQKKETPTTTYTPTPTSTYVEPSTTAAAPTTTAQQSSAAVDVASTTAASSVVPTSSIIIPGLNTTSLAPFVATTSVSAGTPQPTYADPKYGNLVLFNQAVTYLGNIVVVGASLDDSK